MTTTTNCKIRVCIFGEPDTAKAALMEKIKAMLEAEGIQFVRGVDSPDVVSIHLPTGVV